MVEIRQGRAFVVVALSTLLTNPGKINYNRPLSAGLEPVRARDSESV